jgi:SsrA-binding protein
MSIIDNKKAFFDYFIEDRYEAGLVLEGWEVKAIRDGRVQIKEAYVVVRNGELYLFGAHISALTTASAWSHPEALRTRKLLLHKAEIDKLVGKVERSGYTLVPLNLHFKGGRVKCEVGLAKGKKQHDKRDTEKDRDAKREVEKAMKQHRRLAAPTVRPRPVPRGCGRPPSRHTAPRPRAGTARRACRPVPPTQRRRC